MMKKEKGFTLIELVAVIVILGALAVVALPRFISLQDEAREAATDGVAGSLGSGSAVNFAGVLAGDSDGVQVTDCSETPTTLQEGTMPNGYSISNPTNSPSTTDLGETFSCTVENDDDTSVTADFTAIYVSSADL
jgi:MSHA pilin protein MshA